MNPLEKREEVACAALRSPMSVEAQKVSVRKGETSSPLPSLIPSLAASHLPIPHVSLAMPKTWQERERERERRRMRTPIFFFALPPPSPFIRRPTARFFFH